MSYITRVICTAILPRIRSVWRFNKPNLPIATAPGIVLTPAERQRLQAFMATPLSEYVPFDLKGYCEDAGVPWTTDVDGNSE